MICPKCGCQLNDDAQFCIYCGLKLSNKKKAGKNKTNVLVAIVVAVAVLFLAGLGAMYYFLVMDHDSPELETDPIEILVTEPSVTPETTESPESGEEGNETQSAETEPDECPAGNSNAGIPKPDYSDEVLKRTYDFYWDEICRDTNATSYSLLNMFGDAIPELIIKSKDSNGSSCYNIYFIFDGQLLLIQKSPVTAEIEETLYGNNGTLIITNQSNLATAVSIDKTLTIKSERIIIDEKFAYTDTALSCAANDDGLLNMLLFGSDGEVQYSGWVRHNGLDYRYVSGKCVTNRWYQEDGVFSYVGNNGYVVYATTEDQLKPLMDEYWQGFVDACHAQDVDFLKHATDKNRDDVKRHRMSSEWNRGRTFSGFESNLTVVNTDASTGSIVLNVDVIWSFSDNDHVDKPKSVHRYYEIDLISHNGHWLVDEVLCKFQI